MAKVFSSAATKNSLNAGVDQQPRLDSLHISLFPLLELLLVQVPAGHLCSGRCRTSDVSFRYESFCEHASMGWTFSLCTWHLNQPYDFLWLLWFSLQDWCRYAARTSCYIMLVCHTRGGYKWLRWDSSLKLSRTRQHSRYPAFTFSEVPVAKSNIIGVFPKCQDTEAVSQFRGWIIQGPHFSCRYVIRGQGANKNCLILQFTGHLTVLVKNLEESVQTDYEL